MQGFKSFPDKTVLEFNKGITAVVGPNGSGKSNISDAVRWVLGEQSTKTLRGSKMEDVIFSGTNVRKAKGFAEVTLRLDNTDRSLNKDSDEVSVTRRYYRSGDSEYLVNGESARLRDVNELFMDTGLGRVTPLSVRAKSPIWCRPRRASAAICLRKRREFRIFVTDAVTRLKDSRRRRKIS